MDLRSEEVEKEDGGGNKKDAIGAKIPPNVFFAIMGLMCSFGLLILVQIEFPISPFSWIHGGDETDFPIFFIALITLFAAALTVWISWLIKEEAMLISENIIRA